MKLSVVFPLYRSSKYLDELYERCVSTVERTGFDDFEIILVHDASPEDDLFVAKTLARRDSRVRVIDLASNYGQHRALMIGLEHVNGDVVFVLDSDLEEAPEWLETFHRVMLKERCDVVYGVQTAKKRGFWYRTGRLLFYRALRVLSGVPVPEGAVTARLMTRRYVKAVVQFRECEIDIAAVWAMAGFSQIPVRVHKLDSSPSSYTASKLLRLVINSVTSVSTRPLIAGALIGIIVCLVAFGYTFKIFWDKLVFGTPIEGWSSLMSAILIIGGLNLLLTGTASVYIAKIFLEVKQRPIGIVKDIYRSAHRPNPRETARMRNVARVAYDMPPDALADWAVSQQPREHLPPPAEN